MAEQEGNGTSAASARESEKQRSGLTFESYEDFSGYFPVTMVDEFSHEGKPVSKISSSSRGLVIQSDFSLSTGLFIASPDMRYYNQSLLDEAHRAVSSCLGLLKPNERLQFNWTVVDEMEPLLQKFSDVRKGDPAFVRYVRKHRFEREVRRIKEGKLRQFSCSCYLQKSSGVEVIESEQPGLRGLVGDFVKSYVNAVSLFRTSSTSCFSDQLLDDAQKLWERVNLFEKAFINIPGIQTYPVHSTDIIRQYQRIFSPSWWLKNRKNIFSKTIPALDLTTRPMPFASLFLQEKIIDSGHTFKTGDFYHRILTLSVPPSYVEMGYWMTALTSPDVLDTATNLQFTLNLAPKDKDKEIALLRQRWHMVDKRRRSSPQKLANLEDNLSELMEQIKELENNPRAIPLDAVLCVHIWDRDPNQLERSETQIQSTLTSITTAILKPEDFASLPYCLEYCVPGHSGKGDVHRRVPLLPEQAAPLVPLMGEGFGILQKTKEPIVPSLFETAAGTPFAVDFFARGRVNNFNGIGIGESGTGKSFVYNNFICSYANRDAIVFVIDAGVGAASFKTSTKLLGGTYIDGGFRINALGTKMKDGQVLLPDEEDMARILSGLQVMLREGEGEQLGQGDLALLTSAVDHVFRNPPSDRGFPYLRDLPDALERHVARKGESAYDRAQTFAQILRNQYCSPTGDNVHAKYGDGPSNLDNNSLITFDLRWALKKTNFMAYAMTLVFQHINRVVDENLQKPSGERKKIIVITDEGWKVLFDPATVDIYLGLWKAGRSRDISAHLLTQDFSDLLNFLRRVMPSSDDVKSSPLLTSSSHIISMRQSYQEAKLFGETFNLPEEQWGQMPELLKEDGMYSEFGYFCRASNASSMVFNRLRYLPLEEECWGFSSSGDDDARRQSSQSYFEEKLRTDSDFKKRAIDSLELLGWDPSALHEMGEYSQENLIQYFVIADQIARKNPNKRFAEGSMRAREE